MSRKLWLLVGGTALVVAAGSLVLAQDARLGEASSSRKSAAPPASDRNADDQAIRQLARTFLVALSKGDAGTMASLWTEEGEFVPEAGPAIHGRPAIERAYQRFFQANSPIKAEGKISSLRFLSRDSAMIEGTTQVWKGTAVQPVTSTWDMLVAREGGPWRVAMLSEKPDEGGTLHDLNWLIGTWVAKSPFAEVQTTYAWDENRSFILVKFSIKEKDRTITGTERIGEDPRTGAVRCWIFGDNGGFGQAEWDWDGKRWIQEAEAVQSNGSELTSVNLLTPVSQDVFIWQSVERTLDGKEIPSTPPIRVTRVK